MGKCQDQDGLDHDDNDRRWLGGGTCCPAQLLRAVKYPLIVMQGTGLLFVCLYPVQVNIHKARKQSRTHTLLTTRRWRATASLTIRRSLLALCAQPLMPISEWLARCASLASFD